MDDVQKMFKTLINGQLELSIKIDDVHREVQDLRKETREGLKKVDIRMDKLGKSLAYLEEDAPTREEFTNLETKVTKFIYN